MRKIRLLPLLIFILMAGFAWPGSSSAQVDVTNSFFIPQAGSTTSPQVGTLATRFFRGCPNNDGGSSYPNSARIKITLKNSTGGALANVPASEIYIAFNGGTPGQGFSGDGSPNIVANPTYNPGCPLVQALYADAATNMNGETYITFAGASPSAPGVAVRDPNRKWGNWDSDIPVYAMGVRLQGRLVVGGNNGDYALTLKNLDVRGSTGTRVGVGEAVWMNDVSCVAETINVTDLISFWKDFDSSGVVNVTDLNLLLTHLFHDCDTPNNP